MPNSNIGLNVEHCITSILENKIRCSKEILIKDNFQNPLTWKPFYLTALELTYLFLEIEKAYGVQIPEQDLHDYSFCTITQIAESIKVSLTTNVSAI